MHFLYSWLFKIVHIYLVYSNFFLARMFARYEITIILGNCFGDVFKRARRLPKLLKDNSSSNSMGEDLSF